MSTVLSRLESPEPACAGPGPCAYEDRLGAGRQPRGVTQRIFAYLAERRRVARTVAQLEGLSDRMLADIGLQRCDITGVARHGRDADLRSFLGAMR